MKRLIVFSIISSLLAGGVAPAQEGPQTVKVPVAPAAIERPALRHALVPSVTGQEPGNAAPVYLTAALLLGPSGTRPRPEGGEANEDDLITEYLAADAAAFPREAAEAIVAAHERVLAQTALAARREYCHWEQPLREEGADMVLPHLAHLRRIARLLALRARIETLSGRHDEAVRTVAVGLTLGRHLEDQAVLVQALVAAGITQVMLDRVRELAAAPSAPNLYWPLTSLPQPYLNPAIVARWERAVVELSFPGIDEAPGGGLSTAQWRAASARMRTMMRGNGGGAGDGEGGLGGRLAVALAAARVYPEAKRALIAAGRDAAEVERLPVDYVVGAYQYARYGERADEVWKAFTLPFSEGAPVLREANRELAAAMEAEPGNLFLKFVPSVVLSRLRLAQLDRSIALLRVVEALRHHAAANGGKLPASLDAIKDLPIPTDPVSGQPFSYEIENGAAVLTAPAPADQPATAGVRYEITVNSAAPPAR